MLSGLAATAAATAEPYDLDSAKPGQPSRRSTHRHGTNGTKKLTDQLIAARSASAACRYDELATQRAGLIASTAATRRQSQGSDRDTATVVLAAGYRLASELCVKRNDDALAWVLADRALTTANDSGPSTTAHTSWSVAVAMRRAGHHNDAVTLLSTSAAQLQPAGAPTDAALATYGSLICTAAYASAQAGKARRLSRSSPKPPKRPID